MKNVTNIELFNGITGRLFALLYEKFPFYSDIDFDSLSSELVEKSDYNGAWDVSELAEATVNWLAEAGYIWLKEPQAFEDPYTAVLSPKGFEVLKATPEVIDTTKTLGENIIELSKDKLGSAMNKAVELAISQGFKMMLSP